MRCARIVLAAAVLAVTGLVTAAPAEAATPVPPTAGVPAGTVLTSSGSITVTQPNTVLENLDVRGTITVQASGVTIRNVRVTANSYYGIRVNTGSARIDHSTVTRTSEAGITGGNWRADRVEITDTLGGDGAKMFSNTALTHSWVHGLNVPAGDHSDGVQIQSGVVNVTIRANYLDVGSEGNSAVFVAPDQGPSSDGPVQIGGNYLNGGNFTLFVVDGDNGKYQIKNINLINNQFGRVSNYGPVDVNVPVTARGNRYADNGQQIEVG